MSVADQTTKALYRYRFGSAQFDEASYELSVAGLAVNVERKPLEVLALLLAHAGEVVTKEELLTAVWAGRPMVETVITNALTKLRCALGDDNAKHIVTQPRVGYRLTGLVERVAVGRAITSRVELRAGNIIPLRPHFQLESLINTSSNSEVWIAHHVKTHERRVYKFAVDGERLSTLKREVTLFRLLQQSLGARNDLVHILDWNFESPPFFIECEFGGESLDKWAKNTQALNELTQPQRMELFLQIADVVAAAHDVGVLHKDIKPANVLVKSGDDANWQIRLTDFGSGRLLDPQRIQDLGITQLGLTLTTAAGSGDTTGTLLYLAPELMNHQAPTIKSDIYALGVMLYQLIVGDPRKPMAPGWERDIDDELLRDDIRAATEGDPAHRLSSVHELIDRLRTLETRHQHLQQERQSQLVAIQARETLRRAQIRRPWMIAAGMAGILFLLGFAVSSWLYVRAIHVQHQLLQSQAQTEQEASRAEAVTEFLDDDVLGAADPYSGEGVKNRTVQEAMINAVNKIDGKFTRDPMTESAIRMTLGKVFVSLMDNSAAEIQWRRAITLLTNAGPVAQPQLLQSRYGLARALSLQAKFDQAAAELSGADQLRSQYGVNDSQTMLAVHNSWGVYFAQQHRDAKAIPHYEQALKLLLEQPSPNLPEINFRRLVLADSYINVNRLNDAEQLSRQALDDLKQQHNSNKLLLALADMVYGESLLYQRRYQAAGPAIEQGYQTYAAMLGPTSRYTISILNIRCTLYSMTQRWEEALQCARQSYDATRINLGDQHVVTLSTLSNVGISQYALNHYAEATRTLEAAYKGLVHAIGIDNYTTQETDYYLARCLLQLHQVDRAELLVQPLDAKILEGGEPGAPWVLRLQLLHGLVSLNQGRRSEALTLLHPVAQLRDDADPTDTILQEARQALRKTNTSISDQHLANVQYPE